LGVRSPVTKAGEKGDNVLVEVVAAEIIRVV
jgi:hypothetical protein